MHANPNNTAHTAAAQKAVDTAQMCLANGQLKNALKHFQHAVALMPHVAALHALIGDVFIDMGHPNQAIEKYTNALRLEPKNPAFWNNLGNILRNHSKYARGSRSLPNGNTLRSQSSQNLEKSGDLPSV